jgi:CubicO group peptidase (beta-lactamase class C family)
VAKAKLFADSALIAQQGHVLLSKAYGLADREQNIPNTVQSRFRLMAITEQFTAAGILLLQSQGKLNVTDPVCKYLPNCPATWKDIALRQLMSHTSGIPDYTMLPDYLSTLATPASPVPLIGRVKDLPLTGKPGAQFAWTSSGPVVLGYVIEQVSGQSYPAFIQQNILAPLNLHDTGYGFNSHGAVKGYTSWGVPFDFVDETVPYAQSGLYSTVEDLYRWVQALTTDQLMPRAALAEMFEPQVDLPNQLTGLGRDIAMGYGWDIDQRNGRRFYWYWDLGQGFQPLISYYPDQQVAIILLCNQDGNNMPKVEEMLSAITFGDPLR